MGLLRWLTKNSANTHEPTHGGLHPVTLLVTPGAAAELVRRAVASMRRWRVESASPGELRLTRRTRVIGFVDDVTVTIEPAGPGAIIHAASKSRVGVGDLGQNRRNILELWVAIQAIS